MRWKVRTYTALLAVCSLTFFPFAARADIVPAHQIGNNAFYQGDDCAACHIPQGKAPHIGYRVPVNPAGEPRIAFGVIGVFCLERCHLNVTGATGDGGDLIYADVTLTVAENVDGGYRRPGEGPR